ncbi:MAG: LCP family protein [Actinobacteria bacterium]|nr:LCP family protein [Actinomycetota bacterium]
MSEEQKPYRVYRGGRVKGKVPLTGRPASDQGAPASGDDGPKRRRRRRYGLWLALALLTLVALVLVWLVAAYFSFRSGVAASNDRLPQSVMGSLTEQSGLLTSHPTQVLLLGTDGDLTGARAGARRADSIMVLRTDPKRHRLAYLSIPRDLRVEIPGYGEEKINSAFQLGGPALALKTVRLLTGLQVNHVVIVNFADFRAVIDELGGIDVDVPSPIVSNRFDCPYTEERCATWEGWRFEQGRQHMDGRRALVYSRIRENRLDAADNDLTRGERQQAVIDALTGKLTSFSTFLKLPFVGDDLVKPLTTDLSAGQLLQLGWTRFRADGGRTLHCRLGGDPTTVDGQSVIVPTEDNRAAIAMFAGASAPQPPPPGSGLYGPGCTVG